MYFLTYFFSQNNIFLSQQISRNNVLVCFFSEANEAYGFCFINLIARDIIVHTDHKNDKLLRRYGHSNFHKLQMLKQCSSLWLQVQLMTHQMEA